MLAEAKVAMIHEWLTGMRRGKRDMRTLNRWNLG